MSATKLLCEWLKFIAANEDLSYYELSKLQQVIFPGTCVNSIAGMPNEIVIFLNNPQTNLYRNLRLISFIEPKLLKDIINEIKI